MLRYQKNPKGSSKLIEVDEQKYIAKYIGKGQYSKVYRVGDRVVYYTRGDCGKEALAMFQYNRMMHLPELIRHENVMILRATWYVFSSPYYRDVRKTDISAWKSMKAIIGLWNKFTPYDKQPLSVYKMMTFVNYVKLTNDRYISYSMIRALQELVYVASNCGEGVNFDLYKKNFGVNEYGTLIFRDPIYVRE